MAREIRHRIAAAALGVVFLLVGGLAASGCRPAEREPEGPAETEAAEAPEAEGELEQAGREMEEGLEAAGDAIERGAERFQREVAPVIEETLSDAGITATIKTKLAGDPEINPFQIDVDTVDRVVTLNGRVKSEAVRAEAEKHARQTEGVAQVVNLIRVGDEPPPTAVAEPNDGSPPPPH